MNIQFEQHTIESVTNMQLGELEKSPFGVIQLDPAGQIKFYNAAEGDITGRKPEAVLGKNFFVDVAPCTNRPEFRGRFLEVLKDRAVVMFEYTFDHAMKPTKVSIQMKKHDTQELVWVVVKRV